jgi:aspartyl-tRNA(Asn)/glutamyl-tRNA(Gln) amidotransferase subunit B
MAVYRPTIGLEVHAELTTQTKMFCDSKNDPDETRPNINVCPVCMAHPGTLPVINREAVRHILRIGTAVGGKLADFTEFDRKSYFYPDIPKGYQISQYIHPLVSGGTLAGVDITRVHLEEDTARSMHSKGKSLVDFNRAGIPLMELVTEPVIHDAETAGKFARELQLLLRTLGAGKANLEKGEMRIEANISVSSEEGKFGTKVEVKNLNSFRSVERAIAFEIKRQTALIESGGKVVQETRGWDEGKQETFHQRFKEGSADYRYFPEPDLPKLYLSEISEFAHETIRASLPDMPWELRARYEEKGVAPEYIEMFLSDERLRNLFEQTSQLQPDARTLIANYIGSDIVGLISKFGDAGLENITPEGLAEVMQGVVSGSISSRGAKDAITEVFTKGGDLAEISEKYLQQSDEGELMKIIEIVLSKETKAVAEYKSGKQAALQYLVGKTMKESGGAGNPGSIRKLLEEKLS